MARFVQVLRARKALRWSQSEAAKGALSASQQSEIEEKRLIVVEQATARKQLEQEVAALSELGSAYQRQHKAAVDSRVLLPETCDKAKEQKTRGQLAAVEGTQRRELTAPSTERESKDKDDWLWHTLQGHCNKLDIFLAEIVRCTLAVSGATPGEDVSFKYPLKNHSLFVGAAVDREPANMECQEEVEANKSCGGYVVMLASDDNPKDLFDPIAVVDRKSGVTHRVCR